MAMIQVNRELPNSNKELTIDYFETRLLHGGSYSTTHLCSYIQTIKEKRIQVIISHLAVICKSSYGVLEQQNAETEVMMGAVGAVGAVVYLTSVLPQSDPCSVHRLHRCAHETMLKDPG